MIENFIGDVMTAVGLPAPDAAKVAQLMTEADLTGAEGHGILRLPQYVRRLKAGGNERIFQQRRDRARRHARHCRVIHGSLSTHARRCLLKIFAT